MCPTHRDAYRARHPKGTAYSRRPSNGTAHTRIDHIWVPNDWVPYLSHDDFFDPGFSDHLVYSVTLTLTKPAKNNTTYLKFNNSHLHEDEFIELLEEKWSLWQKSKNTHKKGVDGWFNEGLTKIIKNL